ncbi:hypothetical protein SAMN05444280_105150 [Tangfeifania diversioriginum]|uniref:Uncharacterized protein n=1 Tax=Tangfeifania diversioriginum TaxID=1168035 RepID=A0A1M6DR36_9BACT|nr:hypothetical protein [Tangfeifania diversioriginum]SHI75610.1 hypothetical protein SAMN05444280_105150 [Tangfeifania diversioriginum]
MKKLSLIFAVVFIFGVGNVVNAQVDNNDTNEASHQVTLNIPKVALVDIEGSNGEANSITLTPSLTKMEAGAAVDFSGATNSDLALNYTSIVEDGETRDITVGISNNLPTGLSLEITAGGIFSGAVGNPGTGRTIELAASEESKSIVTGIGSVYTGIGNKKGHPLTYNLKVNDSKYSTLEAASSTVTVTYTITGDAANVPTQE